MSNEDEFQDERPVGYGNPPRHSRFKPGQSGNPRGRPKGSRSLSAVVKARAAEKVIVTENGQRREIPRLELLVAAVMNKGAKGNTQALKLAFDLIASAERLEDGEGFSALGASAHKALLEEMDWLAEVQRAHGEAHDDPAD